MAIRDKLRELRWRRAGHYSRPLPDAFLTPLAGGHGLEVGGPSAVFGAAGLLPAYAVLAAVDGLQWSATTVWHTLDPEAPYAPDGIATGALRIADDTDLTAIPDASYDVVLSSHVIEHFADPLRALAAWRRVTRPGGHLLLVAPHMEGTFDHRREVTTLAHLRADREAAVTEGDLTHIPETLRLHDRNRDAEESNHEAWARRRRDNATTRVLHHHVFTTTSLAALLQEAGLELLAVEARRPHDIYVLARWGDGAATGLDPLAAAVRASPFRRDRP